MQQSNSLHLQVLPADEYSKNRYQVNDDWIIECLPTIFGNTRVCLRQKGDITLMCNWCAGDSANDIEYLFNVILGYIQADDLDRMPMCSRTKPYYQDEAFKAAIRPYYHLYISFNVQMDFGTTGIPTYTAIQQTTYSFTLQS